MMPATIPTLETERLHLCGFKADDFEDYLAIRNHPENAKWLGGVQSSRNVWNHMAAVIGHWHMRGYGRFCVRTKEDDAMVGIVGPSHPAGYDEPEIAYTVHNDKQGKGYATEAAKACLNWGYRDLGWDVAISTIDPENRASQSVARKFGAKPTGQMHPAADLTLEIWRYPPAEEFLKH